MHMHMVARRRAGYIVRKHRFCLSLRTASCVCARWAPDKGSTLGARAIWSIRGPSLLIVGKGAACVLEHVLVEHVLDRLGVFGGQVLLHPRVLTHVVELRLFPRVGREHHVALVPGPHVVVVAEGEVLAPLLGLSALEDRGEVRPLHLLGLLYA